MKLSKDQWFGSFISGVSGEAVLCCFLSVPLCQVCVRAEGSSQASWVLRWGWAGHTCCWGATKKETPYLFYSTCVLYLTVNSKDIRLILYYIYIYVCVFVCVSWGKDRFSNEPFEGILGIHLQKDHFLCALDWKFALGTPTCAGPLGLQYFQRKEGAWT